MVLTLSQCSNRTTRFSLEEISSWTIWALRGLERSSSRAWRMTVGAVTALNRLRTRVFSRSRSVNVFNGNTGYPVVAAEEAGVLLSAAWFFRRAQQARSHSRSNEIGL